MKSIHYSVVTWTSWRLKSPAARIVQVLQQNSKALHNCSSERGIHHWSGDSHHKGPVMLFSVCMSWRQMLMYYLCCSSHSMCVVPCVKFNNDELIYSTYGYFLYFYIGACVHFGKWILTKTILFFTTGSHIQKPEPGSVTWLYTQWILKETETAQENEARSHPSNYATCR